MCHCVAARGEAGAIYKLTDRDFNTQQSAILAASRCQTDSSFDFSTVNTVGSQGSRTSSDESLKSAGQDQKEDWTAREELFRSAEGKMKEEIMHSDYHSN